MKHHLLAKFINDLRDTAIKYAQTQQLREQIKSTVSNYMNMTIDDNCSLLNEWQIQDNNIYSVYLNPCPFAGRVFDGEEKIESFNDC